MNDNFCYLFSTLVKYDELQNACYILYNDEFILYMSLILFLQPNKMSCDVFENEDNVAGWLEVRPYLVRAKRKFNMK